VQFPVKNWRRWLAQDAADKEGLIAAKADGVTVTEVPADGAMALEFRELVKGMDEEWIASVADRNVDAKAALEEMRSIAQSYGK
jgi:TRAP-type C4-dicarboxylate transport system substrate-binding protein